MPQVPWARAVYRSVGARIQKARREYAPNRLTQKQLADKTKGMLSRSSIANIERGLQGISLPQLYAVARALDVEPADLVPECSQVFDENPVDELAKKLPRSERSWVQRVTQTDDKNEE